MKYQLPCDIVRDLMPTYADELTSETTNQAIREHLETCADCKAQYQRMTGHIDVPEVKPEEQKEIDFLKKTRKRFIRNVLGVVFVAALILVGGYFVKNYLIGFDLNPDAVATHVTVYDTYLDIEAWAHDGSIDLTGMAISQKDDVVTIHYKGAGNLPGRSGYQQMTFGINGEVSEVYVADRLIWNKGVTVEPATDALYKTKTDYIGDIVACGKVTQALHINEIIGSWENELHTSEEPYAWCFSFTEDLSDNVRLTPERADQVLKEDACVLLALIGNLDQVRFDYEYKGEQREMYITRQDASVFAGKDIKTCATSAADLQVLLDKCQMIGTFIKMGTLYDDNPLYCVNVRLDTDDDIMALQMTSKMSGEAISFMGMANADSSRLKDAVFFEVYPTDVGGLVLEGDELMLSFSIYDMENNEIEVEGQYPVEAERGIVRDFILKGNAKIGYHLEEF